MPSIYDQYRLSNSTVVPQFTGTTAPEALQVGQHMQQLYDVALAGAGQVGDATNNLQSMEADRELENEVRTKIQGDIAKMSAAKDWENYVEPVRALGRYYASRSMELAAPLKQFQEYQKSLDDAKLNLTPEDKKILIARSRAGYKGLQKDPNGRFVGGFSGVGAAEHVDLPKWADSVMQGMKEFKGGSIIEYSDGKGYLVQKGSKREWVSPQRVQEALNQALGMDAKVQSYLGMKGENARFVAGTTPITRVSDTTPGGMPNVAKQEALRLAAETGLPAEHFYGQAAQQATVRGLMDNMSNYLRTKYAYDNRESTQGLGVDSTWQYNEEQKKLNGLFGDLVTDVGIDLTAKYGSAGDIETAKKTAATGLEQATIEVQKTRQTIAAKLGVPVDKLNEAQISDYFTRVDETGFGKYKANLQAIESNKSTLSELSQLTDTSMDLAVKKKFPGMKFSDLKQKVTDDMTKIVKDGVSFNGRINGQLVRFNKDNIDNYEVVDGDETAGKGSGNYIVLRDKKTGAVSEKIIPGYSTDEGAIKKLGANFNGIDWKNSWKEAATNLRSNSIVMPLLNHTTPDGQLTKAGAYAQRVASALTGGSGGLEVTSLDGTKLDSDDIKDMRARIGSGQFKVNGVTKRLNGKLYVKLAVTTDKDADDPADQVEEVLVAADTNLANKLSQYAIEAGNRDGDMRTVQFGVAMKPGSGYEQVLNMGSTGRLQIEGPNPTGGKGTPIYEIVPQITGQASDAISYEVYRLGPSGRMGSEGTFNDAFDLGMFIDQNRQGGRTVKKLTK